jgi:hypothetical protein
LLLTAATPLGRSNSPQRRCHASHAASRTSVSCLRPLFLATVPCARPFLSQTIVRRRCCCSGGDLRDLRVLRSGGLPAPVRWRVAGRRAGMTKTPSDMRPQGRVGAGGLQERARRRRAAGARPRPPPRARARAAPAIDNPVPVKMGGRTVAGARRERQQPGRHQVARHHHEGRPDVRTRGTRSRTVAYRRRRCCAQVATAPASCGRRCCRCCRCCYREEPSPPLPGLVTAPVGSPPASAAAAQRRRPAGRCLHLPLHHRHRFWWCATSWLRLDATVGGLPSPHGRGAVSRDPRAHGARG